MVALLTTDPAPGLPALSAAVCAIRATFRDLHVHGDYCPLDARRIEDALPTSGALAGTLTILDPLEVRAAEHELDRTVAFDECHGGALYLSRLGPDLIDRWPMYERRATRLPVFAFTENPPRQRPEDAIRFAQAPDNLDGFRVVLADTPGYRVAVISFIVRRWGVALWTGHEAIVSEVGGALRAAAKAAGHAPPPAADEAHPDCGLRSKADVQRAAARLYGERAVRDEALRELCRQAAIRGVADRRRLAKRWLKNGTLSRG